MSIRVALMSAVTCLTLVACGAETTNNSDDPSAASPVTGCESAFRDAAKVDDMHDTAKDLWPAFRECSTLDEFRKASAKYPAALDGADPETYAKNQCDYEETLKGATLCAALG